MGAAGKIAAGIRWMERARCKGNEDPAFFPEPGDNNNEVRRYCAECPVRDECLEYAMRHRLDDGYWGGLSGNQRKKLRSERARS